MAMQWNNVTPNFSGSNAAMRNAMSGIAQATDTFGGIARLHEQKKQQEVADQRANALLDLQTEEFGLKQEAHERQVLGETEAGNILKIFNEDGAQGLDAYFSLNGPPTTAMGNEALAKALGWDQTQQNADRTFDLQERELAFRQGLHNTEIANEKAIAGFIANAPTNLTRAEALQLAAKAGLPSEQANSFARAYPTTKAKDSSGSNKGAASSDVQYIKEGLIAITEKRTDDTISGNDAADISNLSEGVVAFNANLSDNPKLQLSNAELYNVLENFLDSNQQFKTVTGAWWLNDSLEGSVSKLAASLKEGKGVLADLIFDAAVAKNKNSVQGFSPYTIKKHGSTDQVKAYLASMTDPNTGELDPNVAVIFKEYLKDPSAKTEREVNNEGTVELTPESIRTYVPEFPSSGTSTASNKQIEDFLNMFNVVKEGNDKQLEALLLNKFTAAANKTVTTLSANNLLNSLLTGQTKKEDAIKIIKDFMGW